MRWTTTWGRTRPLGRADASTRRSTRRRGAATAPRRRRDRSKESKRPGPAASTRPLRRYLEQHTGGFLSTMELVEKLETMEGDRVFPSFWLFHAPGAWDDYRYGDW